MGAIGSITVGVFNGYVAVKCFQHEDRLNQIFGWLNLFCSSLNFAMFLKEVV